MKLKEIFNLPKDYLTISPAIGGHMAYDHLLIDTSDDHLFAKVHNPIKYTDPVREKHSINYLKKEQFFLKHLRANQYQNVPKRSEFINGTTLIMDAFRLEKQWQWRAPINMGDKHRYIYEVLEALNKINLIKEPTHKYHEIIRPTYETLWAEGWDNIDDQKIIDIRTKIIEIINETDSSHRDETNRLLDDLNSIQKIASKLDKPTNLVLSHNDARQSNIAWHKEKGVMIVDWSWADMAPKKADTTMFLIDLAKNGHDVTNYINDYFDKEHAIVMIGFWLSHSLHKTRDESNTIRIQQIASAVAAHKLVKSLGSL